MREAMNELNYASLEASKKLVEKITLDYNHMIMVIVSNGN
jgi:hypothetical protein